MKILGLRVGRSHSGRRRQRKATGKLERIVNAALLDAALRYPRVLAIVIDKFGELPAYHEDELEPIINNIRAKIHEKAVQAILNHRRRELVTRIDGIIDEVMGAGDRSGRQYKKRPAADVNTGVQNRAPATIYQRRTMGRGPKHGLSLLTFLQSLEVLAFLSKLANQQIKRDVRNNAERIYVVEQNGQTVELNEKEYLSYVQQQQLQQGKKSMTPQLDVPHQKSRVTSTDKTMPGLPKESEGEPSGIES